MKRLLLFLLLASPLFGQNQTTVTGTLVDPNGIAYYPATVIACLSPVTLNPKVAGNSINLNQGANYCIGPVNTTRSGFFQMALYTNASISPAATTWIFTVAAAGTPPPGGNGPLNFSSAGVTISGTSQDVSTNINSVGPAQSPSSATATNATNLVGPGTITGAYTASQINNTVSVGPTYATIQACVNSAAALTPPGTCYVPTGTVTTATASNPTCLSATFGLPAAPCQVIMPSGVTLKFGPGKFTNIGTSGGYFIVFPYGTTGASVQGEGRGVTILANNITGSQFTAVIANTGVNNTVQNLTEDSGVNTVQVFTVVGNGTTATVTCGDSLHATTCGFANGQSVYIWGNFAASGSNFNGGPYTVATTSGSTLTFASAINNSTVGGAIQNIGDTTSTHIERNAVRSHIINVEVKHGIVPTGSGGIGNYAMDLGGGFQVDMNDVDFWGGTLDCFSQTSTDGSGTYGSITGGEFQHFVCHDSPANGIDSRAGGGLTIATAPTGAVENSAGTLATITTTAALSTVNLSIGMCVHVTGVTNTAFNGDFIIQQVSGSAFTVNNNAPVGSATSGGGQVGLEICNQTWSNITTRNNGSRNTGTDDEFGGTFISNLAADSSAMVGMAVYNWVTYNNYGAGMRLKGDIHNSIFNLNSFQNGYGTAGAIARDGIALVTGVTVGPHNNIINATVRKGNAVNAFSTDASTYNNTGVITTATDAAGAADPVSLGNANDGFLFVNSPSGGNGILSTGALNLGINVLGFDLGAGTLYTRSGVSGLVTGGAMTAVGFLPRTAGASDLGSTLLPHGNLWLGTAATNNFKVQPATTTGARTWVIPDWGANGASTQNQPFVITLTSQYTNSTTTFSNVAGGNTIQFAVAANSNYTATCHLYYQAAATGGLNIEFTGPASPTAVRYGMDLPTAVTGVASGEADAFGTSIGAVSTAGAVNLDAMVSFSLLNGANAGTVNLLAKSSAAVQLQIQSGSYCQIQ